MKMLARACISLALGGLRLTAASPQDFLPPAPPWHGASEALVAKPGNPWITPAEKMQLLDSPNYDDTIAWLRKLADASPLIDLQPFGQTAQGRTLYVVVATKAKGFTPAALHAGGKPIVLAQAGIHSGEIDGKDAGLMLLRDLAFGGKDALLDRANFLFVPVFNADGHERSSEWNRPNQRGPVHQGWRATAQNLNLNRDYMKADAPEMQAMIWLLNLTLPSLYLDLHVTDGMDYQYDITYGYNGWEGGATWSPQSARWLDQRLRPAVDAALTAGGHLPGGLINGAVDDRDLRQGVVRGNADPRFSNGYGDLRHIPSILVENHSLKPYPQRVLGTYVLLEAALKAPATTPRPCRPQSWRIARPVPRRFPPIGSMPIRCPSILPASPTRPTFRRLRASRRSAGSAPRRPMRSCR
ncbi:MAG: Zinc carboxypeptidase [Lacunisphaera sp.]|nr:Zinc carboxypeptidase [Lacunisphaera sp.]